ncbi:unnamed protein product [Cylicocyclus nassatus]|uniref:Uncharacterized protein n=1 Tax=Cylicocyclus nassatus TaxID=53992 RepID=A0AA36GN60_CYLNA|nr:unnamed protein product [Cylicocyclus nassatus]
MGEDIRFRVVQWNGKDTEPLKFCVLIYCVFRLSSYFILSSRSPVKGDKGLQAKELRDATAQAISNAWKDSRSASTALAKLVNNVNTSLLQGFNDSFTAELTPAQREDYDAVVAHVKSCYEGPHLQNMARRALAKCKKEPGESTSAFADRIFSYSVVFTAQTPYQPPDGSVLIWSPDKEESCGFVLVAKMAGHLLGDIWISDSKEFALSWHDDSSHLNPIKIQVGDRVFLRDFAPKIGLSQKLCNPWLRQFRVIAVDPPHFTIISVSAPQSSSKKVHMNQIKKCFRVVEPVFTSPWVPAQEQAELTAVGASDVTLGREYTVFTESEMSIPAAVSHGYNTASDPVALHYESSSRKRFEFLGAVHSPLWRSSLHEHSTEHITPATCIIIITD